MQPKKPSKVRKKFPFYEHHGNLVYIGGVQRKLRRDEEERLFRVLLSRKVNRFGKALKQFARAAQVHAEKKRMENKSE